MAEIHELIDRVADPELKAQLQAAVDKLAKQKKFGLVFEEHLPECTPLYEVPVKKGSLVSRKQGETKELFVVLTITDGVAKCLPKNGGDVVELPVEELVSVAEFGEPIYPYLQPIDAVCHAPDSDLWHTLIEADNYHALQLLEYLYAGKVDCIYIDPPYNTGAKDWKYNNDYVDGNDAYRHSKWLSMMQKRLRIAKKLLNPVDSVLIITIDEKECLHLGCLLEELFPESRIQMISSVISPAGVSDSNMFNKVNEYIFFVMLGCAKVYHPFSEDECSEVDWWYLHRRDYASRRGAPKGGVAQFYPIYINDKTLKIEKIGDPLSPDTSRFSVEQIKGCSAVFPVRSDGTEMNWGLTPDSLQELIDEHVVRVSISKGNDFQKYTIRYLSAGYKEKIAQELWEDIGQRDDSSRIIITRQGKLNRATTVWNYKTHNAKEYGTGIVKQILGNGRFTYPKSIYAVLDCLKFVTKGKSKAIIVDFFAGSGTTLHAVNLLNAEDGGHRRCILVTNNEVSADEAKTLSAQGHQPGDPEWEKYGIARYVTWPRTVCSIEGHDINGQPLKGEYLGSERPMADGFPANAAYFKLGFLDKTSVALGEQFQKMLPTLWMKAGAVGPCPTLEAGPIPAMLVLPENHFAVLTDESAFEQFAAQVNAHPEIETAYLITDYEAGYRAMSRKLQVARTFQLYRDYLDNFRINTGRDT